QDTKKPDNFYYLFEFCFAKKRLLVHAFESEKKFITHGWPLAQNKQQNTKITYLNRIYKYVIGIALKQKKTR
ncbi:MAG: hypothetical protein ACRC6N_12120, partial [Plesiomonas sp.]|uniref:hypothetical protein n=1 Tax=Plesiomonas sp. TaxID=2486279 RepID=UPI003F35B1C7